jgi:hypothetical protein
MFVTDIVWINKYGAKRIGYYMDEFLAMNLMAIPQYLQKSWDVVGICSGHGRVRIGKSTATMQAAYFTAWLLAGGKMREDDLTGRWYVSHRPDRPVRFALENVVFRPEDLIKTSEELFKKYGKHQVIVYDEGRAGLDSARAMETINKTMQEFFQQCGMYGHVIFVVLPNFFKLHEDYAVSRSLFLIDCKTDHKMQRGFFFQPPVLKWHLFRSKCSGMLFSRLLLSTKNLYLLTVQELHYI